MLCNRHCPYQVEKDKGGLLNASNFCHPYVRSCIFHHSLFSYTGGMVLCCWLSLFWAARLSVKTVGISVLWVCGKGCWAACSPGFCAMEWFSFLQAAFSLSALWYCSAEQQFHLLRWYVLRRIPACLFIYFFCLLCAETGKVVFGSWALCRPRRCCVLQGFQSEKYLCAALGRSALTQCCRRHCCTGRLLGWAPCVMSFCFLSHLFWHSASKRGGQDWIFLQFTIGG